MKTIFAALTLILFLAYQGTEFSAKSEKNSEGNNTVLTDGWRANDLFDIEGLSENDFRIVAEPLPSIPSPSIGAVLYEFKDLRIFVSVSEHKELRSINLSLKALSFNPLVHMERAGWYESTSAPKLGNVFVREMENGGYVELWFGKLDSDRRNLALEFRDSLRFKKTNSKEGGAGTAKTLPKKNTGRPKDWRADDLFDLDGLSEGDLGIASAPLPFPALSNRAVRYVFKGMPIIVSFSEQTSLRQRDISLDTLVFKPFESMEDSDWYEAKTRQLDGNIFVKKLKCGGLLELWFAHLDRDPRLRKLAIEFRDSIKLRRGDLEKGVKANEEKR